MTKRNNSRFITSSIVSLLCIAAMALAAGANTLLDGEIPTEALSAGSAKNAKTGRKTIPLSGEGWKIWLDKEAQWQEDELYLPDEVNRKGMLDKMPENPPTGGWQTLDQAGIDGSIPGCVEEYFGEGKNTFRYHGVSWFTKTVDIPADWVGKTVRILVEKARLRAEIYVNGKLAGYDIVAETPFEFEIQKHLKFGAKNQIAIRLTNPGGSRGWQDFPAIPWKPGMEYNFNDCKYHLPNSHDFSGLGHIDLVATDKITIKDIFVKNLLPANSRELEVAVTINSKFSIWNVNPIYLDAEIIDEETGETVKKEHRKYSAETGSFDLVFNTKVPGAKLWSPDTPNLYRCKITLTGKTFKDTFSDRFGFRTFEVKQAENRDHHFYLNGERLRLKTATDWGYYALTGFYAADEMAKNSVQAAKDVGHNGINFHRRIGEPLIYQYADEMGLCLWSEPGGFRDGNEWSNKINVEKCRRMAIRDRNHPSVIIYCLMNESNQWYPAREEAMRAINKLDPTRLVVNTSGSQFPEDQTDYEKFHVNHIRPYETGIRDDFLDIHNAGNTGGRFPETDFFAVTRMHVPNKAFFPGEVISSTGPRNWVKTYDMLDRLPGPKRPGFDTNIYTENHAKQTAAFTEWNLDKIGSRSIQSAEDISVQAGRGLMYMDGRHGQVALVNNTSEGFAINGWSPGPMTCGNGWDWDSAMTDGARNLKGPAEDYRCWVKPAQIAILRDSMKFQKSDVWRAKYLKPGQTADFEMHLINEGILPAGKYTLEISVLDGSGRQTAFSEKRTITVEGGDTFAQELKGLSVQMQPDWKGGYITVAAKLKKSGLLPGGVVAEGREQVLLQNRPSFGADLAGLKGAHWGCPAGKKAMEDAGLTLQPSTAENLDFLVLGGEMPARLVPEMLRKVKEEGTLLLIEFDGHWAEHLYNNKVISKKVTEWGGKQTNKWYGNGWGYLDHFIGDQAFPGRRTLSTNGWEVPADPVGFYPFSSDYKLGVYGMHMARPWISESRIREKDKMMRMPMLTALIGTIQYGKGTIILNSAYHVGADNPFSDLLFYNMIRMGCENNW